MSQSRAPRPTTPQRARAWRRTIGAFGGVAVLVAAASACSGSGGSLEKPNLNVGVISGIGATTLALGENAHDFSANGLNINVSTYPTDAAEESALKNGTIDVALGDYSEFLDDQTSTIATEVDVVDEGYDAGTDTIGLVAAKNSSLLNTPESTLASQIANNAVKVEVPTGDSPEYLALATWEIAEQSPLNPNGQNVIAAGANTDGPDTAAAEIDGVVSGASGTAVLQEPYLTQAIETGKVVEVADLDSGNALNMPIDGWFVMKQTAKADPNTIAAFQSALSEAQTLTQSRVEVEDALTAAKVSPVVAATTAIGVFPNGIVSANLQNVLSLMQSANVQVAGLSPAQITSTS